MRNIQVRLTFVIKKRDETQTSGAGAPLCTGQFHRVHATAEGPQQRTGVLEIRYWARWRHVNSATSFGIAH